MHTDYCYRLILEKVKKKNISRTLKPKPFNWEGKETLCREVNIANSKFFLHKAVAVGAQASPACNGCGSPFAAPLGDPQPKDHAYLSLIWRGIAKVRTTLTVELSGFFSWKDLENLTEPNLQWQEQRMRWLPYLRVARSPSRVQQ